MKTFEQLLVATSEQLVNWMFPLAAITEKVNRQKLRLAAKHLNLSDVQLVCALGFNSNMRDLADILTLLGYASHRVLIDHRNQLFIHDVYLMLPLKDVLALHAAVRGNNDLIAELQTLLIQRLTHIEVQIEATVKPRLIDQYKTEVHSLYLEGIAQVEFAEARVNSNNAGFRALVNEIKLIVDRKLIPIGDIVFRNTVLPEEKRKVLDRGLVPESLIRARLDDQNISQQERDLLTEFLAADDFF
jgi:hypothetical protein